MVVVVAVLAVLAVASKGSQRPADVPPYEQRATWRSEKGGVETGLTAVAVDPTNQCLDLVAAAGNDVEAGSIAVFGNRARRNGAAPFVRGITGPDWTAADVGFHTGVAAGRFDDDALVDLVAVELFDSPGLLTGPVARYFPGALKLYRGIDCRLPGADPLSCRNARSVTATWPAFERQPSTRVPGLYALNLAVGDANGDGRLDIAVPIITGDPPPVEMLAYGLDTIPPPASTRIFLNGGGATPFSHGNVATTATMTNGVTAVFADVNRDGLMDLVVGGDRLYVHLGTINGATQRTVIGIEPTASLVAEIPPAFKRDAWLVVSSLDVGWIRGRDGQRSFGIVAGFGCPRLKIDNTPCGGGVATFIVGGKRWPEPEWTSSRDISVAHLRLANVDINSATRAKNDDGDILVTSWRDDHIPDVDPETPDKRGALRIFSAQADGTFDEDFYVSSERFIGQQIVARDLGARSVQSRCMRFGANTTASKACVVAEGKNPKEPQRSAAFPAYRRVLTLPDVNIHAVTEVLKNGRRLPREAWAVADASPSISFRDDLLVTDAIEVLYVTAATVDVAVATFDVDVGVAFFSGRASLPPACRPTVNATNN